MNSTFINQFPTQAEYKAAVTEYRARNRFMAITGGFNKKTKTPIVNPDGTTALRTPRLADRESTLVANRDGQVIAIFYRDGVLRFDM